MGSQQSKGGAALDAKANGQENGHVKTNGDVTAKQDGEAASGPDGIADAAGEAIEPAPPAQGEAATADTSDAKCAAKKKFSLNSFKFKGFSLKKSKNSREAASVTAEEVVVVAAEEEEEVVVAAEEEEPAPASEPAPTQEASPPEQSSAALAVSVEGETSSEPRGE